MCYKNNMIFISIEFSAEVNNKNLILNPQPNCKEFSEQKGR